MRRFDSSHTHSHYQENVSAERPGMTDDVFLQELIPLVQDRVPEGLKVVAKVQMKNNGTLRSGITLKKETGTGTFPFVYLEPFYPGRSEALSMEAIADEVSRRLLCPPLFEPFKEGFPDAEKVLESVIFRLVNHSRNEEFLRMIVNRDFLDLSLLYGLYAESPDGVSAVCFLKKETCRKLDISEEELFRAAFRNSSRIFRECLEGVHGLLDMDPEGEEWLYVLSNRQRMYGASTLIYGNCLNTLAEEKGSDILILPSSIHELIVTPETGMDRRDLKALIKEVNDRNTPPEDVLSDNAYIYRKDTGRIEIFTA